MTGPRAPGCSHPKWTNHERTTPLICAECGVLWPGRELPVPFHIEEGLLHQETEAA